MCGNARFEAVAASWLWLVAAGRLGVNDIGGASNTTGDEAMLRVHMSIDLVWYPLAAIRRVDISHIEGVRCLDDHRPPLYDVLPCRIGLPDRKS